MTGDVGGATEAIEIRNGVGRAIHLFAHATAALTDPSVARPPEDHPGDWDAVLPASDTTGVIDAANQITRNLSRDNRDVEVSAIYGAWRRACGSPDWATPYRFGWQLGMEAMGTEGLLANDVVEEELYPSPIVAIHAFSNLDV